MAKASVVLSTAQGEVRITSTDTPDNPRVRMDFSDVAVFFSTDDAHEIGARLIAAAAVVAADSPRFTEANRDDLDDLSGKGEPLAEAVH